MLDALARQMHSVLAPNNNLSFDIDVLLIYSRVHSLQSDRVKCSVLKHAFTFKSHILSSFWHSNCGHMGPPALQFED